MALTSRARSRCIPSVALGLTVAVTLGLGVAAPAFAGHEASTRRSCPDGTQSVYETPAPSAGGGFLLDDGAYRTFSRADAVSGSPTDINNRGDIIGNYSDTTGAQHGFRIDRRGCFRLVDYPGGPRSLNEAIGVNDRRQVIGTWGDYGDERTNTEAHGYVHSKGRFSSIDVPGALVTSAFKNNNRGQVVGSYSNEARARIGVADAHGFVFHKGRIIRIDVPGAAKTLLVDINDRGQVLGVGMSADNTTGFGFVRDARGHYTRLPNVPGSLGTTPLGFNNRDQIVGFYIDGAGAVHGYLLDRGRFKTIDVPGFTNTMAWGINDSGQIVGGMANAPPPRAASANAEQAVPEPMSQPVGPVEGRP